VDVRVSARSRWKDSAYLGRFSGSKTFVLCHDGDDRAELDQVILAIKAWMFYRWQQNNGLFLQRGCRRRAWQREINALKARVARASAVLLQCVEPCLYHATFVNRSHDGQHDKIAYKRITT